MKLRLQAGLVQAKNHYENKLTKNIRPAKIWQIYTNFEQIY